MTKLTCLWQSRYLARQNWSRQRATDSTMPASSTRYMPATVSRFSDSVVALCRWLGQNCGRHHLHVSIEVHIAATMAQWDSKTFGQYVTARDHMYEQRIKLKPDSP